ncbi:MAG TPA: hypothetical protein VLX91_03255 [Candidatus Acidoferrales bacterium]|nr:hypothetical protein [Candidatus Acidoferrales bacterium]
MKTRLFLIAISFLTALSLSSCYTEFAATGDGGYSYSSPPSNYYDSSYAATSYDTTGAPIINNYNYYGYGYPYYDGYYDNWWTPSPWWWHSNFWLSFGWGTSPWYTGWWEPYSGYGYNGYGPYYNGYGPYYNPYYYYSPYYPNRYGYVYQPGNPTGRVRPLTDTRTGRESYGGGTTVPYVQPVGTANVGNANSTSNTSTNANQSPNTRTRTSTPSSTGNNSSTPTNQPRVRSTDSQPQPRVRDNGNGRGNDQGNQGRSRGHSASSFRVIRGRQSSAGSITRGNQRPVQREYTQPRNEPQTRSVYAPRYTMSTHSGFGSSPTRTEGSSRSSGGRTRR